MLASACHTICAVTVHVLAFSVTTAWPLLHFSGLFLPGTQMHTQVLLEKPQAVLVGKLQLRACTLHLVGELSVDLGVNSPISEG